MDEIRVDSGELRSTGPPPKPFDFAPGPEPVEGFVEGSRAVSEPGPAAPAYARAILRYSDSALREA